MFAFTLDSLVLRGVVLTGELLVSRLGFGVVAEPWSPGNTHSVRPSTTGQRVPDLTEAMPEGNYPTKGIRSGAGRSRCLAGSSIRRLLALATRWQTRKGLAHAAAQVLGLRPLTAATVGKGGLAFASLPPTRTGPQGPAC